MVSVVTGISGLRAKTGRKPFPRLVEAVTQFGHGFRVQSPTPRITDRYRIVYGFILLILHYLHLHYVNVTLSNY